MDQLMDLPDDLLWRILGYCDVLTLCTARLVCNRLRQSATCDLKTLYPNCATLEQLAPTDFPRFAGVTSLQLSIKSVSQLELLAHPRIAPVVTHVDVRLDHFLRYEPAARALVKVMLLPKLRSLCVTVHNEEDLCDIACLHPGGFEDLQVYANFERPDVQGYGFFDVSLLTRFTNLNSLGFDIVDTAAPSLGSLTCLHNLRSLYICSCDSVVGVLSKLTMLTGLTWSIWGLEKCEEIFRDMRYLTGLCHFEVTHYYGRITGEDLASVGHLTRLTCLDISWCHFADSVAVSSALVPLTGLISVGLQGNALGMALLASLNVGALRSLTLKSSCANLAVLQGATGLTHLAFECDWVDSERGLRAMLCRMSELRSLHLSFWRDIDPQNAFHLAPVLRVLTNLTELDYTKGNFDAPDDLMACASLPLLRHLVFQHVSTLTPACLPALQALSGLTELRLINNGIHLNSLTPEERLAFDVERLRRGWPRLRLVGY
jgi:hypothetical protein